MTTTSEVYLIKGRHIRLAREIPERRDVTKENADCSHFDWSSLNSLEAASLRSLYSILEEDVRKKVVRRDLAGKPLAQRRQPRAIKEHLDLIPGMRELIFGSRSDIAYPASRGYVRWIIWEYQQSFKGTLDNSAAILYTNRRFPY